MTTKELKAEKLAEIVELVAMSECELREHNKGGPECPDDSPDDEDWCLVCIARQALAAYREDE